MMVKKKWIRFPQERISDNVINRKMVVTEDDFAVWGLGKLDGFNTNYADITKRVGGYEIAVGSKGTNKGRKFKKLVVGSRDQALKELIKEMGKYGRI